MIPRPYQSQNIASIREAFKLFLKVLYVLPTGGGKTFVFCYIAARMAASGKRLLILVHRDELIRQVSDMLNLFGVHHGIVANNYPETRALVQVGSVLSVVSRMHRMDEPYLIIPDEAHHCIADSWMLIMHHWPRAFVLGVTATPCRADGRGLGEYFEYMVLGPIPRQLMDLGYLSRCRCYGPSTVDLSGVRSRAGEYRVDDVRKLMERSRVYGDAVKQYKQFASGKRAVMFCATVPHAVESAQLFNDAGISAASVDGKMEIDERRQTFKDYNEGRIKVLTNQGIVSEGLDVPGIEAVILARPTMSESFHIQSCGRGLRTAPGKTEAIILDLVGNCGRHGLPDEDRIWTLTSEKTGGRKSAQREGDSGPSLRTCSQCYAIVESYYEECPVCGAKFEPRVVQQKKSAADLEELKSVPKEDKRKEIREARTVEQLRALAEKRGYKAGWVRMMQKVRAGR